MVTRLAGSNPMDLDLIILSISLIIIGQLRSAKGNCCSAEPL
uniref:Uncharacterized protein n=1 Tax=Anguilla anguilla TaxID=7936 RepID=A0A0E9Q3I6_ANGAN